MFSLTLRKWRTVNTESSSTFSHLLHLDTPQCVSTEPLAAHIWLLPLFKAEHLYSVAPSLSVHKSDLSHPACARLSVHSLCSVDLGQEDLVVLNLTSGTEATYVRSSVTDQMKQLFGFSVVPWNLGSVCSNKSAQNLPKRCV